MKIAVLMVCYNSAMDTINCIRSFLSSLESNRDYLLLYDNSDDIKEVETLVSFLSTLGLLQQQDSLQHSIEYMLIGERIAYFRSRDNLGFAQANNYLLKYAFANLYNEITWVWFLNNDTLIDPIDYSSIKEYAGAATCDLLYSQINTFDNQYESNGLHYINLLTSKTTNIKKLGYNPYVCGASFLLRFSKRIPLWNEEYFLYYEDIDYYFTLMKMEYEAEKIPGVKILHKVSASTKKVGSINLIKLRSQKIFMRKYAICYFAYFITRCIFLLVFARFAEFKFFIKLIAR